MPEAQASSASRAEPQSGIGLCLSGGGYRAMLFLVGALWRLYEVGVLHRIDRISSVSGGSIAAAVLAANWHKLPVGDSAAGSRQFRMHVVEPVRRLARHTIDWQSTLRRLMPFANGSAPIAPAYDQHLFDGKTPTLQDLPDRPRFVINATNQQSGAVWRFSKPYMRDWRVGEVSRPKLALSLAVAASSAFPPFLSPLRLTLDPSAITPGSGRDLQHLRCTGRAILTDGGVHDNLGLGTIWKRYSTVLIADGGQILKPRPLPGRNWFSQLLRIRDIANDQTRSLRKRIAIEYFERRERLVRAGVDLTHPGIRDARRKGAYWGIGTDIAEYGLTDALRCPAEKTQLAAVATRLARLHETTREHLINWGFAVCDAAVRRYLDPELVAPQGFPFECGLD
jgi:NTE family protein